jgi:flagellar assembly protein FliH
MAAILASAPSAYGVIYAEDFDDPAPPDDAGIVLEVEPDPEPEVIEPSFTPAELDAARAAAFAEGATAERACLAAEDAATRSRALDAVATALAGAAEAARTVAEEAAEGLAQAVLSLVAAGLPALCAQHGEHEARALLRSLLPTLGTEPRITVRLNPDLLEAVRADLAGLDPEIAAAVQLLPTDTMPPGDVRVSWEGGTCQRSAAAACAAVREALAPLGLLLPEPRPETTHRILETARVE